MIEGLERAAKVLDVFSSDVPEWTANQVAGELGLPRTTTWEWMQAMAELGLLRRTGPGRYRLGWRAFQLGNRARMTSEIARPALEELAELAEAHGQTVHLAVRHRRDVVYLEKITPRTGLRTGVTRVGERLPAHCAAVGKVLLSVLADDEIRALYPDELPQLTERSVATVPELIAQLAQVRRDGRAEDVEGVLEGMCCVAAPVRNRYGEVTWALGMAFPEYRHATDARTYADAVAAAAGRLSALHDDDSVGS